MHPWLTLYNEEGPGLEEWVTVRRVVNHWSASHTHTFRDIWLFFTSCLVAILVDIFFFKSKFVFHSACNVAQRRSQSVSTCCD
jgi:hypothetical protein